MFKVLSEDQDYCYFVSERISTGDRHCIFIRLNPEPMIGLDASPTMVRCLEFTKRFSCDVCVLVSLFAACAESVEQLKQIHDPVGPENLDWISCAADLAERYDRRGRKGLLVCAWGTNGTLYRQDEVVLNLLSERNLFAMGYTNGAQPRHPLSVQRSTRLLRLSDAWLLERDLKEG